GAIAIEMDSMNSLDQRAETAAMQRLRTAERHRAVRTAMEGTVTGDHAMATSGITRELQRPFIRLGAAVAEEYAFWRRARSRLGQAFGEFNLGTVIKVGARHVDQFRCLIRDRGDDVGMAMSGRIDGDAGREVEEPV